MLNTWLIVALAAVGVLALYLIALGLKDLRDGDREGAIVSSVLVVFLLFVVALGIAVEGLNLVIEEVEITGRVEEVWVDDGDIFVRVDGKVLRDGNGADLDFMPVEGETYTFQCTYCPDRPLLRQYEITGAV